MKYTITMTDGYGTTRSGSDELLSDALTKLLLCVDESAPPEFQRLLLDEIDAFHTAMDSMRDPPCSQPLRLEP